MRCDTQDVLGGWGQKHRGERARSRVHRNARRGRMHGQRFSDPSCIRWSKEMDAGIVLSSTNERSDVARKPNRASPHEPHTPFRRPSMNEIPGDSPFRHSAYKRTLLLLDALPSVYGQCSAWRPPAKGMYRPGIHLRCIQSGWKHILEEKGKADHNVKSLSRVDAGELA
eukprot:scaffold2696_cov333-Pavlova_lutheri.AAC.27